MPKGATKSAGTTGSEYQHVFYRRDIRRPLALDMHEEWFLTFLMLTFAGSKFSTTDLNSPALSSISTG